MRTKIDKRRERKREKKKEKRKKKTHFESILVQGIPVVNETVKTYSFPIPQIQPRKIAKPQITPETHTHTHTHKHITCSK